MSKRVIVFGTASEQALVRTIEELRQENAALINVLRLLAKSKDVPNVTVAELAEYAQRAIDAATDKQQ